MNTLNSSRRWQSSIRQVLRLRTGIRSALHALLFVAFACCLQVSRAQGLVHNHGNTVVGIQRSTALYRLPDVQVVNQDGHRSNIKQALDDGRPVVLNFIYTTCNAICPVSSQVFMQFREQLGAEREGVNMVSISIDPEQDTPRKLTIYSRRFASMGNWAHYTGTTDDSVAIQRAFDAWRGDKMNHVALTLMRSRPGQPWLRLEGFTSPDYLLNEYRQLMKSAH